VRLRCASGGLVRRWRLVLELLGRAVPGMSRRGHTAGTVPRQPGDTVGDSNGARDCSSRRLLSVYEAADHLGVSHWTVRDMLHAGTLKPVRLPLGAGRELRRILVDRRDLDDLIERSK
jgi:excisionase family DNA binding protein